jgi:hypothetical protein
MLERNWSSFELHVNSKQWNCLFLEKVNDLVYIFSNCIRLHMAKNIINPDYKESFVEWSSEDEE